MRLLVKFQLLEQFRRDDSFERMYANEAELHRLFIVYELAELTEQIEIGVFLYGGSLGEGG